MSISIMLTVAQVDGKYTFVWQCNEVCHKSQGEPTQNQTIIGDCCKEFKYPGAGYCKGGHTAVCYS